MEKKQTAVDWIESKLNSVKPTDFCSIETIKDWVKQAKQMEKEQIIEAHDAAYIAMNLCFRGFDRSVEYYEATYGK